MSVWVAAVVVSRVRTQVKSCTSPAQDKMLNGNLESVVSLARWAWCGEFGVLP